jgi:hypothetical protein
MVRNPNYWDPEIPYLDGIEPLHIPAWTDRGTAVLTGQADYSPNVSLETHQEGLRRKDIVGTVPGEFTPTLRRRRGSGSPQVGRRFLSESSRSIRKALESRASFVARVMHPPCA